MSSIHSEGAISVAFPTRHWQVISPIDQPGNGFDHSCDVSLVSLDWHHQQPLCGRV